MLPSGLVAAAFLLSLVPGWWFLRRTESGRRPRQLSALQEALELAGVGVLTTGLAVAAGMLAFPGLVLDHQLPADTPGEIRLDVALICGTLVVAIGLAEVGAVIVRKRRGDDESEINIGPWWAVMRRDNVPDGKLPYVAVALTNGSTVEGVLHNYSWSPDSTHRDIALMKPIQFTEAHSRFGRKPKTRVVPTPYDYLLIPSTEIRHAALKYVERG